MFTKDGEKPLSRTKILRETVIHRLTQRHTGTASQDSFQVRSRLIQQTEDRRPRKHEIENSNLGLLLVK